MRTFIHITSFPHAAQWARLLVSQISRTQFIAVAQ